MILTASTKLGTAVRALAALMATTFAAQADLPSPLFCITVEMCEDAQACVPRRSAPPFVLRETGGEWVMQVSIRDGETWVAMVGSVEAAMDEAPEGVRVAMVDTGLTGDGAIVLHEHGFEPASLSARFARHHCRTSDGATS